MNIHLLVNDAAPEILSDLASAKARLLEIGAAAEEPVAVTLLLEDGPCRLSAPITFSAEEEPALDKIRLTVAAAEGAKPVISGNIALDGASFQAVDGKPYYKYQFEKDANGRYPRFHDFYVDGKRIPVAESESFVNPFEFADRPNRKNPANLIGLHLPMELAKQLDGVDTTGCELTMHVEWECATMHVTGVDLSDTAEHEGQLYARVKLEPRQLEDFVLGTNGCLGIKNRVTLLANHPLFLNPDTYCYNCKTGELFYQPSDSIAAHSYEIPVLENLLVFRGLKGLKLENIAFTGTTSKYICDHGYLAGQANNERNAGRLRHAAVVTGNLRDFTMKGCSFEELGANGMLMVDRSVKVSITECRFVNIGMSALSIGNPTTAWENPINQNIAIHITNNTFKHIGYEYPTSVAFYMGIVDGLKFMHNTMDETAYSAVSVGWGWSLVGYELGEKVNIRDAEIAYNRITNYMDILRDGAAIYVLGANCTAEHEGQFNFMHDNYAERSLFHDSSKRGYYMDGSASNWEVWDNVTIGTHLPIFSQFHVPSQFTHHNYIHDIYTTDAIDPGNHAPYRDTIVGEWYYVKEDKEGLFAKYPKAVEIFEASGVKA